MSLSAVFLIICVRHKTRELKRYKKMHLDLNETNPLSEPITVNGLQVIELYSPLFLSERQHLLTEPLPVRLRNNEAHLCIRATV